MDTGNKVSWIILLTLTSSPSHSIGSRDTTPSMTRRNPVSDGSDTCTNLERNSLLAALHRCIGTPLGCMS